MNTWIGLPMLAGLLAIAVAFGGGATMDERRVAVRVADGTSGVTIEAASFPLRASATDAHEPAARRKARCKDCGVVESVDRIERPDVVDGVCPVSDDINIRGNDLAGGGDASKGFPTLANMTRVAAAQAIALSAPTPPRYRIVVRLRNGARQIFDESTSRTLRSGDFVHVI